MIALRATLGVYPRACGGTCLSGYHGVGLLGLSPRVRGNLYPWSGQPNVARSIPARAGEPRQHHLPSGLPRVYPRACGGTSSFCQSCQPKRGLSPRVRGNLRRHQQYQRLQWSIPARAGEPGQLLAVGGRERVYPRACGGTPLSSRDVISSNGLSPRVRGNPHRIKGESTYAGSIPARAGEPS